MLQSTDGIGRIQERSSLALSGDSIVGIARCPAARSNWSHTLRLTSTHVKEAVMEAPETSTLGSSAAPRPTRVIWASHLAVWLLAGLAARLSRTGSMLELHATGRDGAELAPEHVRQILTAPTTEFKAISLAGVLAALILALAIWKPSPRPLRWLTLALTVACVFIYLAGYGVG